MNTAPVVYLVDDDPAVGDACSFLLEAANLPVHYWADSRRFLAEAPLHGYGCVILDVRMPGLDGLAVHERLRSADSTLGVVMLTAHGDVAMAVDALKHGAVDFLQKPMSLEELLVALDAAFARSQELLARRALKSRVGALSRREREVAELVSLGLTNREIAERLCLVVRTVEVHRANAMRKLDTDSTADLARLWERLEAAPEH